MPGSNSIRYRSSCICAPVDVRSCSPLGPLGVIDPTLRDMAQCGKHRSDSHACKNLHALLHRSGYTIPVKVTTVTAPVRLSKRGSSKKAKIQYPVLQLSDWCRCIFKLGGHFLMGGWNLDQADAFGETLQLFWRRFQCYHPDLPFYAESHDWKYCIPFALHGDEGRGAGKKPIMVISAQPMITLPDMSDANSGGSRQQISSVLVGFRVWGLI